MARDRVRDRFTFGGIKKVSLAWFDDRWEDTVRVQVRGTLLAGTDMDSFDYLSLDYRNFKISLSR